MRSKSSVVSRVNSVKGQIAEVQIESDTLPMLFEILTCPEDPEIRLEVFFQSEEISSCLILSNPNKLYRGMLLSGTGSGLRIPASKNILGRVVNFCGEPQDDKGPIASSKTLPIYAKTPPLSAIKGTSEILETGIKALDFLAPFLRGGRIGFIGGAGVGKTILMT